jgi:membrane-bound serine protease (ClpP class)
VRAPGQGIKVFVHGEYWDADADDGLAVGDPVEVLAVDGLRLRVRRRGPRGEEGR